VAGMVSADSQLLPLQNKAWAWQILRARLLDQRLIQQAEDRRKTRQSQVKGMDRSDKVRTYNFPQVRRGRHLVRDALTSILAGSSDRPSYRFDHDRPGFSAGRRGTGECDAAIEGASEEFEDGESIRDG
jgi:hypothetical protein